MTKATLTIVTHAFAFMLLFTMASCGHKGPLIAPDPSITTPIATHTHQENNTAQNTFELPNNL